MKPNVRTLCVCLQTTDRKEIAKKIAAWPKENASRPRIVVITQGADPVIVVKGTSSIRSLLSVLINKKINT